MADEAKKNAVLDKKALAAWRTNFDLHVLLVMKQEGVSKAVAQSQAYYETLEGAKRRMSP